MPRKQAAKVNVSPVGRTERLLSDTDIRRLHPNKLEVLYDEGKANRSDADRWVEMVKANPSSGRIYEPVYRPRTVRGKLQDRLYLKRREDIEAELGVGEYGSDWPTPSARHHATTKKSPAQLDREIAEWQAARSGLSKHHQDLLSRRKPGGGLRAGYLTPSGWHGDPMVIEDRKLRLEALREQPAPRFPKERSSTAKSSTRSHATKKDVSSTARSKPVSKPGPHGTLYRYSIIYTDQGDSGFGAATWNTWAYDPQHAVDRFYESDVVDSGWRPLRVARQQENVPAHRWTWHSLGR